MKLFLLLNSDQMWKILYIQTNMNETDIYVAKRYK